MSAREIQPIQGLFSNSANPELREKLMLFGQFVGDWDILEDRFFNPDGTEETLSGELHWGWILDGKAVQDVWMFHDEESGRTMCGGTTIRYFDPQIDAWHSIWISPIQNIVMQFIGRKAGNEIVLEGKRKEDNPVKWIFSDIKPDSFTWREELSKDGGKTWILTERMKIRRRK